MTFILDTSGGLADEWSLVSASYQPILIVVSAVLLVLFVIGVMCALRRRRKNHKGTSRASSSSSNSTKCSSVIQINHHPRQPQSKTVVESSVLAHFKAIEK